MKKRSFGLALFVVIISMTLVGCACMQHETKAETVAQVQVVEKAPPRAPEPVQRAPEPVRPVKQDRN